jgi:hypothetical protein
MEALTTNGYYIISLCHPMLRHYNENQYTDKLLVQYKGYYKNANGKESVIFHHTISNQFEDTCSPVWILTHICQNFLLHENVQSEWESHIYRDRFYVKKDLTPVVRSVCLSFKQLLKKNICTTFVHS